MLHISAAETLVESPKAITAEVKDEQEKLRDQIREKNFHVAPVPTRVPKT